MRKPLENVVSGFLVDDVCARLADALFDVVVPFLLSSAVRSNILIKL